MRIIVFLLLSLSLVTTMTILNLVLLVSWSLFLLFLSLLGPPAKLSRIDGLGGRFLLLLVLVTPSGAVKPETVLLEFLGKPFAPSEWGSVECLRDSGIYLGELEKYTPWALQMYDASVKIPAGLITGNYQQLGNYDECLEVKSGRGFTGQSCTATVQFEIAEDNGGPRKPDLGDLLLNVAIASNATRWRSGNTVAYEWMWCLPSTCNHTEVQEALELALDPLKVEGRVDLVVNVPKESCHTMETDRREFDVADWIYISILVIFAMVIVASTSYDIARQGHLRTLNRKDTRHTLLTAFSFYTNGKNLLRTERHRDSIGCLDGLRYLSICWIIFGHTFYGEVVGVKMNLTGVPRMHLDWSKMLVLNGNIVTDTFFLLSGILMSYTEMSKRQKEPGRRFDTIGLYVHRYLRLTPPYAMMIGFYATLLYKFGTGPKWDGWVGSNRNFCRQNWWTNLLYVNNYVNVPTMCMSQSWYLATDMQLVWLSPILLYPMLKFSRSLYFWLSFSLALILSVLLPFFITYSQSLTGTMLYYKDPWIVAEVYTQIYTRVYNRFGPYIIGLALGYVLFKTRSRTVKMPTMYVICGWLCATVAGLSVVFGPRGMYREDHYDRLEASFYAGFHRQIFALSVSWIVFCSVHGYAGPINKFLSWKGWIPLSRLTYSAYLCHYVFLLSDAGTVRTTTVLSSMAITRSFLANLCLTMALSAIWSLSFEMPFMILDRALITGRRVKSGLTPKPNQTKLFGSTDSGKEIYRSTEETSSSVCQAYKGYTVRSGITDSVYNSAVSIGYQQDETEEKEPLDQIDRTSRIDPKDRHQSQTSYIYVIASSEGNGNGDAWPRMNGQRSQGYQDQRSEDEDPRKENGCSCAYGSIGVRIEQSCESCDRGNS